MKWKELMKKKKLLSLLLAGVATFTIIFVSYAVSFITTKSAVDLPVHIISGDIKGDMLMQGSDGMHPLTLPDDTMTPILPALNSKGTEGLSGDSFKILLADSSSLTSSSLTQVADGAAGDPGPAQNIKGDGGRSDDNNSTQVLIPANKYPEYDRDVRGTNYGVQVTNYNNDPTPDDVPPSAAVPEPTTMILLGSGLLGLATLRKRWRKK